MNLYRTTYIDDAHTVDQGDDLVSVCWDGTLSDAAKRRKALKADGMRSITTVDQAVPTDKPGLLKFLNDEAGAS